ncbi:cytochrome P450 82C4-like, partial [Trifolium medium]|nr:cytochrome P450 82C4-like [Trifolium medium]MCH92387.1 cytochrome P450 82C4-like [Trifolium medium]
MDNNFLSPPTTIALTIVLVLLYNIWRIKKPSNKSKGMKPPEPSYALPLIGAYPALIISNQEAIKECFTTNDKILASRPKSSHGIYLGYNFAGFGFAPYGTYWSKLRKLTMFELLSSRRIESLRHVYESEIDTLIKDLFLYVKVGKVKVVISEWLERLTFNIITKMICGKRYFEYLQDVDDVEAHGQVLKSMKRIAKDLDTLVGSWVEEHVEKSKDGVNDSNEKHDFIDVMLSVIEDDPASGHNRDTIIKANVM